MSENKKTVYFQDKNPYNPYNFRVKNKKSVQSVHFGHPGFYALGKKEKNWTLKFPQFSD